MQKTTITAKLDLGNLRDQIKKIVNTAPAASFTIQRELPVLFVADVNDFNVQVAQSLATKSDVVLTNDIKKARIIMRAKLSLEDAGQSMGLYKAKAKIDCTLVNASGEIITENHSEITAAHVKSCDDAKQNAARLAIDKAVGVIETSFR